MMKPNVSSAPARRCMGIKPPIHKSQVHRTSTLSATFVAIFFSILFSLSLTSSFASHYRGGTLSWQKVSGQTNTVKFTMNMAWRSSAWGNPSLGSTVGVDYLQFGDGSYGYINLTVTSVNTAEDWFYGTCTLTHTYAGSGPYRAYWSSCCRISNLQNNHDGSEQLETTVTPSGSNSSPVATLPAIVNMATGQSAGTFTVPYNDPDGDAVKFRLATSQEASGSSYGFSQPSNFSINATTGVATFNTNGLASGNLYSAVVVVEDKDANGNVKTKTMVDFIIKIVVQSTPPSFDYSVTPTNGNVYSLSPGQNVSFKVKATDADPGDVVTLQAVGLPTGVSLSPSLPTSGNPVTVNFSWTPTSAQLGSKVVTFIAQDKNSVTTYSTVTFSVSMKPVFDVGPTPANNSTIQYEPGSNVSFKVQASNADATDMVQLVSIPGYGFPSGVSLSAALPTTAANPTSTTVSWTPLSSQWGLHEFRFRAQDANNYQTDHLINIVVNEQPYFTSTAKTTGVEGKQYSYSIVATDPDLQYGDALEIVGSNIPSWLSFTDNGDGTASLSGTPSSTNVGTYNITFVAEDIYHHGYPNIPKNVQTYTLTVYPALQGNSIKSGQSVCYNTAPSTLVTDVAVSGGDGTYSNQWQSSTDGVNFSDISGATNETYSPGNLTSSTWYQRVVTGGSGTGTITSNAVKITVLPLPSTPTISTTYSNTKTMTDNTVYIGAPGYDCGILTAGNLDANVTVDWYDGSTKLTSLTSNSVKVCPTSNTTYTLVITNSNNCSISQDITINAVDVTCGNNHDKVIVCHNDNSICIARSAVATHLGHGDYLGSCHHSSQPDQNGQSDENTDNAGNDGLNTFEGNMIGYSAGSNGATMLNAFPNPLNNNTNFVFGLGKAGNATLTISDVNGRVVNKVFDGFLNAGERRQINWDASSLAAGVYCVYLTSGDNVLHLKLVISR